MENKKIFRHFFAIALVIIIGVCMGKVGRSLYELNYHQLPRFVRGDGDDIPGETEIVANARTYFILPILPQNEAEHTRIIDLLAGEKIDYVVYEGKIMLEPAQIPLAMDLLQVAGLGAGARYFSPREITVTADQEPRRHALQLQLTKQNALEKVLTQLTPEILAARVVGNPATGAITVKITRRDPRADLSRTAREHILAWVKTIFGGAAQVKIIT